MSPYWQDDAFLAAEKRAGLITGAIKGADRMLNESAPAQAFLNADMVKWFGQHGLFHSENGVAKAKTHFFQDSYDPFGLTGSKGLFKIPVKPFLKFPEPMKKGLDFVAKRYNNLSPEHKAILHKGEKYWNGAVGVQMGAMVAGAAANAFEAKPVAKQMEHFNPHQGGMRGGSAYSQQQSNFGLVPPPNQTPGYQTPFSTQQKRSSVDFRKPEQIEIPTLIRKLSELKDEFMLQDRQSVDLMVKNLLTQDTFILGKDLMNMKGFINGGRRGLPVKAPGAYYIRFIWVEPAFRGQGVVVDLISNLLKEAKPDPKQGVWMQISETNQPMQKVATKLGFKQVDTWTFGDKQSQIWLK